MTPERYDKLIKVLHQRQPNLTVVMENVLDPHNVSAVLRTCEAVGIQDVYVLTSRIPKYERFGPKSSSSAMKWVTVHEFDDIEKCVTELRKKYKMMSTAPEKNRAVKRQEPLPGSKMPGFTMSGVIVRSTNPDAPSVPAVFSQKKQQGNAGSEYASASALLSRVGIGIACCIFVTSFYCLYKSRLVVRTAEPIRRIGWARRRA